jgi:uncharacterized protein YjbI with pentapeptide repeats
MANSKELDGLEKALNDASGKASVLWTTFVTFELYLAIAFGSVKHRDLFLETPVKLPILNVDLPLVAFFVVAPALLVIFHFYVFLQLYALATKARDYDDLLKEELESSRQRSRQRLDTFLVLQFLAGPKEQRGHFQGLSLRLIAWITLVATPVLILLQAQVTFLPYHDEAVSWTQRLLLLVDLIVIWGFWDRIRSQDDPILGSRMSRVWPPLGIAVSVGAFIFSAFMATFPGESADDYRRKVLDSIPLWSSVHQSLFAGEVDKVTGRPQSWFSNRLVLTDQIFVENDKIDKLDVSHSFRGRDLRAAVLDGADLRKADFTGAKMEKVRLENARLEKAQFRCASRGRGAPGTECEEDGRTRLQDAWLGGARLQGAQLDKAHLEGAWLYGAQLQGASLYKAHLQEAKLTEANLQGAWLGETQLQGDALKGAHMQGVSLAGTQLQGARLAGAELQGAWLNGAKLQGASLDGAQLEGASLDDTYLQGASLAGAQLQGASLAGARLQGASLDNAYVWRVTQMPRLDLASFEGAPNCTDKPWEQPEIPPRKQTYDIWRAAILSTMLEGDPKSDAGERLWALDPQLNQPSECPGQRAIDAKQLAEYLITLVCLAADAADAAPHVARGLIQNGRIAATGVEIASIADRLRRGKADTQTCPGVVGFTEEDWARLDQVVADVQARGAKASGPRKTPDGASPP